MQQVRDAVNSQQIFYQAKSRLLMVLSCIPASVEASEPQAARVQSHMIFSSPSESAGCPARLLPTKSNTRAADKLPSQGLPPGCDQARLNVSRDSWRSLAKECFESAFWIAADTMPCQWGFCDANLHMLQRVLLQHTASMYRQVFLKAKHLKPIRLYGRLDDAAFVTRSAFVQSALGMWLMTVELDIILIPTFAAIGTSRCHVINSS